MRMTNHINLYFKKAYYLSDLTTGTTGKRM